MRCFADRLNIADLDGLVVLYEPSAVFEPQPGVVVHGHGAIGQALRDLLAIRPSIVADTVQVLVAGDVALVVNEWVLTGAAPDGISVRRTGRSADVVRLQPGGRWLVVIDKP
jgi:ketosteroid isomerase-like protein